MKTSMSIIIFFAAFLSISAISIAKKDSMEPCMRRSNSLAKKSPVEACIRRNIAQSLSPSPSNNPKTAQFEVIGDQLCRDETRIIVYFLKVNGKFPPYYVKALCNVFGDDEKKVKEYVIKKWLNHSKKLINSLTCASR